MSKNLKKVFGVVGTAAVSLVPMAAFALQDVQPVTSLQDVPPPNDPNNISSFNGILQILVQILGYIQALFWLAAVFFGLYAAFLYLTAQGDGEKISKANKMLIYVVIAVIVAVIAYSIPTFVKTTINT